MSENIKTETIIVLNNYARRWSEINALNHIWFYMKFGFEYGSNYQISKNIEKMYQAAPMFFSISRIAIERTSRIELVKLFEGQDKASIAYLRKYLEKVSNQLISNASDKPMLVKLNSNLQSELNKYSETINGLKEIRHKHLVHNDLGIYINPSELYEKNIVEIDKVFNLIQIIGEYIDNVSALFGTQGCPKYTEILDIQSLEMYFRDKSK